MASSHQHSNSSIIKELQLQIHPEGGYFKETDRQEVNIPSPFANDEPRSLSTSIYYLITYHERCGKLHMNKSLTYHVLHHGRAEYTLIYPPKAPGEAPKIVKHVMGTDVAAGETRLLIVEGGVWKMSAVPQSDIDAADQGGDEAKDHTGCLITEVVTPGFHWEDHQFLTRDGLVELFGGVPDGEKFIQMYEKNVKQ